MVTNPLPNKVFSQIDQQKRQQNWCLSSELVRNSLSKLELHEVPKPAQWELDETNFFAGSLLLVRNSGVQGNLVGTNKKKSKYMLVDNA